MKQIGFYEGLPLTDKNSFLEKLAETPVPKKGSYWWRFQRFQ